MMKSIDMNICPPIGSMMVDCIGEMTEAVFFERLLRAGTVCSCGVPYVGLKDCDVTEADIRQVNDSAFHIAKSHQGKYIPAVFIHPGFPEVSSRLLKEGRSAGLRIAGYITQSQIEKDCYANALRTICDTAAECDMTILVKTRNVQTIERLAKEQPKLRMLVLFECVTGISPQEIQVLLKQYDNVYICLSMPMLSWNYILHSLIEVCPKDRFVYGSGYPFINPSCKAATICWELRHQSKEVLSAVLYQNAARLLGLEDGDRT